MASYHGPARNTRNQIPNQSWAWYRAMLFNGVYRGVVDSAARVLDTQGNAEESLNLTRMLRIQNLFQDNCGIEIYVEKSVEQDDATILTVCLGWIFRRRDQVKLEEHLRTMYKETSPPNKLQGLYIVMQALKLAVISIKHSLPRDTMNTEVRLNISCPLKPTRNYLLKYEGMADLAFTDTSIDNFIMTPTFMGSTSVAWIGKIMQLKPTVRGDNESYEAYAARQNIYHSPMMSFPGNFTVARSPNHDVENDSWLMSPGTLLSDFDPPDPQALLGAIAPAPSNARDALQVDAFCAPWMDAMSAVLPTLPLLDSIKDNITDHPIEILGPRRGDFITFGLLGAFVESIRISVNQKANPLPPCPFASSPLLSLTAIYMLEAETPHQAPARWNQGSVLLHRRPPRQDRRQGHAALQLRRLERRPVQEAPVRFHGSAQPVQVIRGLLRRATSSLDRTAAANPQRTTKYGLLGGPRLPRQRLRRQNRNARHQYGDAGVHVSGRRR